MVRKNNNYYSKIDIIMSDERTFTAQQLRTAQRPTLETPEQHPSQTFTRPEDCQKTTTSRRVARSTRETPGTTKGIPKELPTETEDSSYNDISNALPIASSSLVLLMLYYYAIIKLYKNQLRLAPAFYECTSNNYYYA